MRTISSFLITVTLIVGMVGCVPSPVQYDLTVSSTEGGEITTPGEGTFPYDEGIIVPLVVFPHTGYRFVNWTGDVGTIADVNAASTTITMNGNCEIVANFEETAPDSEPDRPPITFAIAGPMTDFRGQHQWWGAELARDEINAFAGVNIGGVFHKIELVQVDTNEISGTPEEGAGALQAVIDDVDFVLGGVWAPSVAIYREVAMTAKKIFMNCGASTGSLQFSAVTDYDKYRYWFKSTPYNESFLLKSCLKMTATIGDILKGTLATLEANSPTYMKAEYKPGLAEGGQLRVEILIEDEALWAGLEEAANYYLPQSGLNVTGTTLVSPTATDISSELLTIAARYPHIIFTAFSGSVSDVYSVQRYDMGIPAMTIGLNLPGQRLSHWVNTDGKCLGEIMLDTWAVDLQNTPKTTAFFNAYVAKTGEYPAFTAGTYDAIHVLCKAVDETDSLDSDVLIAWLENVDNAYAEGTSYHKLGFYQMPAIEMTAGQLYALSEPQVSELYDLDSYGKTYEQNQWLCGYVFGVQQPNIAHDLTYGPGKVTGIGAQWQEVEGAGTKVGIWPMYLGPAFDAALTDQYGCWNFEYPGTVDVMIPIERFLGP